MSAGRPGREPYRVYEVDDYLSGAESAEPVRAQDWDGGSASEDSDVPSPDWVRDRPVSRRARRGVPILIAAVVAVLVLAVERRTSVAPVAPGPASSRTLSSAPQPVRRGSSSRKGSPPIARLRLPARRHGRRPPRPLVVAEQPPETPAAEAPEHREPRAPAPAQEFGFER